MVFFPLLIEIYVFVKIIFIQKRKELKIEVIRGEIYILKEKYN